MGIANSHDAYSLMTFTRKDENLALIPEFEGRELAVTFHYIAFTKACVT